MGGIGVHYPAPLAGKRLESATGRRRMRGVSFIRRGLVEKTRNGGRGGHAHDESRSELDPESAVAAALVAHSPSRACQSPAVRKRPSPDASLKMDLPALLQKPFESTIRVSEETLLSRGRRNAEK